MPCIGCPQPRVVPVIPNVVIMGVHRTIYARQPDGSWIVECNDCMPPTFPPTPFRTADREVVCNPGGCQVNPPYLPGPLPRI